MLLSVASAVQSPGATTRVSTALHSTPVMFIESVGQFDYREGLLASGRHSYYNYTEPWLQNRRIIAVSVSTLTERTLP